MSRCDTVIPTSFLFMTANSSDPTEKLLQPPGMVVYLMNPLLPSPSASFMGFSRSSKLGFAFSVLMLLEPRPVVPVVLEMFSSDEDMDEEEEMPDVPVVAVLLLVLEVILLGAGPLPISWPQPC